MPHFDLPDVRAVALGLPEEGELLILGGDMPDSAWFQKIAPLFARVWAVDAGVEVCRRCDLCPDYLVGDRDSASAEAWDWAEAEGAQVCRYAREKDATDFQLALDLVAQSRESGEKRRAVFVTGCFGGRMDHLLSNLSSLLYWSGELVPIGMADHRQGLMIVSADTGELTLSFSRPPEALSLLSLSQRCAGVSLEGVRWPLHKVNLTAERLWAVSNEVVFDQIQSGGNSLVKVNCEAGNLGVYWFW